MRRGTVDGEISEGARFWKKDDRIHLIFTEILHEYSGILRFMEMFRKIRVPEMVLHVFGKGIYEQQIVAIAMQDPAIQYHGYVDMLSEVPVLATAVNGLGEEYYPYLHTYDNTLQGLKNVLAEILGEVEEKRQKKAVLVKRYILKEKNWNMRIGKLWEYLEKENEDKS